MENQKNPCLQCGACCAYFRASFYWREAEDQSPGGVPLELTEHLTGLWRVMKGTNQDNPRCVALLGDIGKEVRCSIFGRRPEVCGEFPPSYVDGNTPNERCDKARAQHGLPPLKPEDWINPNQPQKPEDPDPTKPILTPAA